MKKHIALALAVAAMVPVAAHAQSADEFTGFHAGASVGWNQGQNKRIPLTPNTVGSNRSSVTVRGHIGYDIPVGPSVIAGVEAGIASGGRNVITKSATGQFVTDPGVAFDLTARLGVKPTEGFLLYGKAGLGIQRVRTTLTLGDAVTKTSKTETGLLYGVGAQVKIAEGVALRAEFDRVSFNNRYKRNRALAGVDFSF